MSETIFLKKYFSFFLKHMQTISDFSVIKETFFLLSQNRSDLL